MPTMTTAIDRVPRPPADLLAFGRQALPSQAFSRLLGDAVTVAFKINDLRPVREGERVAAEALVVGHTARPAVCRCEVCEQRHGPREVGAVAQGTARAVGAPR